MDRELRTGQAQRCPHEIRGLFCRTAALEARLATLQSEMTRVGSRLDILSTQIRLDRLRLGAPRPFEEVRRATGDARLETGADDDRDHRDVAAPERSRSPHGDGQPVPGPKPRPVPVLAATG